MGSNDAQLQNWQAPMDEALPVATPLGCDSAILRLPPAYALALLLSAQGLPDGVIGEFLRIEPEAVAPLLAVAAAKLATLQDVAEPNSAGAQEI